MQSPPLPSTSLDAGECWRAVVRRDAAFDGRFVFGVRTTGVYCRPSCPAKAALRRNVRFYSSPAEAERDGLRACLRCHPNSTEAPSAGRIRAACRYIEEHSEERLLLAQLARQAALSPFHFQRIFRAAVGVTPRQYQDAIRTHTLKRRLRQSDGVAAAVYDAGYGSSSRVYERSGSQLGMTPGQYRRQGRGLAIAWSVAASPLGLILIGVTPRGVCFLQFGESQSRLLAALRAEFPAAEIQPAPSGGAQMERCVSAVVRHLEGSLPRLDLPLDIRATAFQIKVWESLRCIPYGEVRSYGEVAAAIGQPSASRAVAQACASNSVALLIPCHRVVRGNGEPGGYRWGSGRKQKLLQKEKGARS